MPRKIKVPFFNHGKPEGIDRKEARNNLLLDAMPVRTEMGRDKTEDELIDGLDDKEILIEVMREFLPVFRRVNATKNPHVILNELQPIASKLLAQLLLTGNEKTKLETAKHILDRTMGKPVERQLNLNADVSSASEEEVDREIGKILRSLEPDELGSILEKAGFARQAPPAVHPEGQTEDTRRNEVVPVQTE